MGHEGHRPLEDGNISLIAHRADQVDHGLLPARPEVIQGGLNMSNAQDQSVMGVHAHQTQDKVPTSSSQLVQGVT